MTFNQINYFLVVAKRLNFTQAAAELFVTQSALSRSIAALEEELGARLLVRDFHNVRLTAAGEIMYCEMEGIMSSISGLLRRVQAAASNEDNKLLIGILAGQEVHAGVLFALNRLSDSIPHFDLEIRKMLHQELVNEIKAGKLDIAETVIGKDTVLDDELDHLVLESSGSYLVARTDDPIWQKPLTMEAMEGRILLAPPDCRIGAISVRDMVAESGVNIEIKPTSDMESHSLWVESGLGVTLCNRGHIIYTSQAFKELRAGLIKELPEVSVALIWSKKYHPNMVEDMLKYLRTGNWKTPEPIK